MRIALPPVLDGSGLARHRPGAAITGLAGETMGTEWRVRFAPPGSPNPDAVRAAIVARLDALVAEMSHWEPNSLLSRFNRAGAGQWVSLPPDFAAVMEAGLAIAAATDGAFDPAIGRVVDLLGFGPAPPAVLPADADLAAAHAASGWRRLSYDPAARRLRQPGGLSLDLSGIAKGHAVDAVADLLATLGIRNCLVEIGGELVGRGLRPDGDPWWVDLEAPPGAELTPFRIALHGIAVATSGDWRRGAHTIDPRAGRSSGTGIAAVSVVHTTAREADAWATALTVLDHEGGAALADRMGIAARIVRRVAGGFCEHITAPLNVMLG